MRAMLLGVGLAIAAAYPALAESADQFDLNCTGVEGIAVFGAGLSGPPTPFSIHFRIDLAAQLFCLDDCKMPERILRIAPDVIEFRHVTSPDLVLLRVRRGDGAFENYWPVPGGRAQHAGLGKCTKAEYTPMPKNAF